MTSLYRQILKNNLKVLLRYKWDFIISFIVDPVVLIINIMLFTSIYQYNNTDTILGYSLAQMIWYFAVATFIWHFIWNFTDRNICRKILSGDLILDLLKPLSLFKIELFQAISLRIFGIAFEFIPSMLIYTVLFFPDFLTLYSAGAFLIMIIFSFMIFFLTNYLIGLSAFYFKNINALISVKVLILIFSAGALIPIEFLPEGVQRILSYFPFLYIFYWPIQFFLNRTPTDSIYLVQHCAVAFSWCVGLYLAGHFLYKRVIRNFCAVG